MFLFIAIIFIAELIIASTLVAFIVRADRRICFLFERVKLSRESIISSIVDARNIIKTLKDKICRGINYIEMRKRRQITKIIQSILIYLLLMLFKNKSKNAAAIINTVVMAKDWYDKNYTNA